MHSDGNGHDVVVGVSGASGAALGVAVVERLATIGMRVHVVVTEAAKRTLAHEVGPEAHGRLLLNSHRCYDDKDIGAPIASGSFPVSGMIVAPCSMKTLAAVATGLSENLLARAADVQLKERRRLVLMARETPLHLGHLRNMTAATEMGAIVMPPVPAFYHKPKSIEEVIDHLAARAIDLLGLPLPHQSRAWGGEASFGQPNIAVGSAPKSIA